MNVEQRHDLQIGEAIRRALNDGNRAIYLVKTEHGWQVSVKRADGHAYGVEVGTDPIETLYRACVPFRSRGQTVVDAALARPDVRAALATPAPGQWNGVRDLFHPLNV